MNIYTKNILSNIEDVISQIEELSDQLERNSWEFASHTEEETFWLKQADKLKFVALELEKRLPF